MLLEMTCTICGRPYEPTPDDDVLDPDADHVCPVCRAGGSSESGDELEGYVKPENPEVPR